MVKRARWLGLATCLVVLVAAPAEAQYLDPGAGSIVIQAIVAGVLGVATVVKLYWSKIKGLFRGRSDTRES